MLKKFGKWYLYALVAFAVFAGIAAMTGARDPDAVFTRAQKSHDLELMQKISNQNPDLKINGKKATLIIKEILDKKAEVDRIAKEKAETERLVKEKEKEKENRKKVTVKNNVNKNAYSLHGSTYKNTFMCINNDKLTELEVGLKYVKNKKMFATKMVNKGECTIVPKDVPVYFRQDAYHKNTRSFSHLTEKVKMVYADGISMFLFVHTSDIKYP